MYFLSVQINIERASYNGFDLLEADKHKQAPQDPFHTVKLNAAKNLFKATLNLLTSVTNIIIYLHFSTVFKY